MSARTELEAIVEAELAELRAARDAAGGLSEKQTERLAVLSRVARDAAALPSEPTAPSASAASLSDAQLLAALRERAH